MVGFLSGMVVRRVLRLWALGVAGMLLSHSAPATAQAPAGAPQKAQAPAAPANEPDDAPAPAVPGQTAKKLLDEANKAVLTQKFLEAVRLAKRALLVDPALVDAHKTLGLAYARLGRYCPSKTHYKAFVDARPDSPMADRIKMILDGEELSDCP